MTFVLATSSVCSGLTDSTECSANAAEGLVDSVTDTAEGLVDSVTDVADGLITEAVDNPIIDSAFCSVAATV